MQILLDKVIHVFLPNQCMFCHAPVEYDKTVCEICAENAPVTHQGICLACGKKNCTCQGTFFTELICPFYYELGVDIAIQDMKFKHNRFNARKLAIYMSQSLQSKDYCNEIDLILPAPMYHSDKVKRGYNQAALLAKWISKYTKIPYDENILVKVRKTKKQHDINFIERQKNLNNAFAVEDEKQVAGKTILLCDDVYTTGATLNSCSKILIENKAKKVYLLTASKTRIDSEVL
ncbi:ComF family protein [Paludicola sp. MB14-C6]|uniref:ComF family protein n=1 Tax=Paludihabitans sp. MB14-C6 TaxID=3070656 RepID=UPI0027DABC22|nr:ComF family protein [Paludicola sp. MB14-C6]WMJ23240.1 ComF family protein [Paludicola sp. MB14-C6]